MTASSPYFVHPSAFVDAPANVGAGSKIWHFSHVMAGAIIGRNVVLGQNVYVAATVVIGDNVKIQNNVSLYDGVVLEDDVFCGPSCVFTNVKNPRATIVRKGSYVETRVQRGATIGLLLTDDQLGASRARREDVHGREQPRLVHLAVEAPLHVAGAHELVQHHLVELRLRVGEHGGQDRERAGRFVVRLAGACAPEPLPQLAECGLRQSAVEHPSIGVVVRRRQGPRERAE